MAHPNFFSSCYYKKLIIIESLIMFVVGFFITWLIYIVFNDRLIAVLNIAVCVIFSSVIVTPHFLSYKEAKEDEKK